MKYFLIIPAAGIGRRFGERYPKQFYKVKGKALLAYTLENFVNVSEIEKVVIATHKSYFDRIKRIVEQIHLNKEIHLVEGGQLRQDSVYNAFCQLNAVSGDRVIIHDAVRPFVPSDLLQRLMQASRRYNCVVPGVPVSDTLKKINKHNFVERTLPRDFIRAIQTPQIFSYGILSKSFGYLKKRFFVATDEANIVETIGGKVMVIEGCLQNIKVTTKQDIHFIRLIMAHKI
ncbi:MAG: 2-C-methyl-D-erythritol 4-phosphate cytidylyltransferase [Ignavibacteria bacterium]